MKAELSKRTSPVPESKKLLVKDIAQRMQRNRTVFLASSCGLPSMQFHEIKKKLRGIAEMKVAKKSAIVKAIESTGKAKMQPLQDHLSSDYVLLFSDMEPFALAGVLVDYQSSRRAKTGDIAPEDIEVEPGPTELVAGPAISELSGVGLKVAVKGGKLEILKGAIVAKKGEAIKANVASVLGKLNISPIKVGFIPIAAYDSKDDAVYSGLIIDKEGALQQLKDSIRKSLGFAISIVYPTEKTIRYFITKAALEEKALIRAMTNQPTKEAL